MRRRLLTMVAALLAVAVPTVARAVDEGPAIGLFYPLVTRRPVIEREMELSVTHEEGPEGGVTETAAAIEWPLLPRWQVELKVPLIFLQPRDADTAGGVGDLELETKVLTFDSIDPPALVAVGAEGRLPSGSERRGLGGEAAIEPFVAAGVALGPFDMLAHVAYEWNLDAHVPGEREQALTASTAVGWRLHRMFTPLLELTTVTQTRGVGEEGLRGRTQVYLTPGFNVRPLPGATLRVGVELPATSARSFDYALRGGLVWEF